MTFRLRLIITTCFMTGQIFAQTGILGNLSRSQVSMGFNYQMWRIGGYQIPISQSAFPVSVLLSMGGRFNLRITHTPAMTRWDEGLKLDGFSDTWVQGTYLLLNERAMFNVGFGAPTGKTELSNDQFNLSNWLGLNIFRFRLPVYGQGATGKLGFAMAFPILDNLVIGFGGQFLHRRPYHPVRYESSYYMSSIDSNVVDIWMGEYKPGDEVSAHVGVDFKINEDMKIMLDALYTYYWRDLRNDQEVYGSGQKISMNLGYLYRFGRNYLWSRLSYRHKGKNEIATYYGFPTIQKETLNTNGFQMELDVVLKIIDIDGGGIFILGDGRVYGRNELNDVGKASVFGGGFGANVKLGEDAMLEFNFKYVGGTITTLIERKVEGLNTSVGIRFEM